MNTNPAEFKDCWLAYFDLLGFADLCDKSEAVKKLLVRDYDMIVEELKRITSDTLKYASLANPVWFSDSFLIYTEDESEKGFLSVITSAKRFSELIITRPGIILPACGVISFGKFFANKEKNIFMGKALVDAVRMQEQLRIVGLFITPEAISQARQPFPDLRDGFEPIEQNFAYTFPHTGTSDNSYLLSLEDLRRHAPESSKYKYDAVIKHIKKFDQAIVLHSSKEASEN